jgi:hypothetical protein
MELQVLQQAARKAQTINVGLQKDVVWLQEELGKKVYLAQANLRRLVDKF